MGQQSLDKEGKGGRVISFVGAGASLKTSAIPCSLVYADGLYKWTAHHDLAQGTSFAFPHHSAKRDGVLVSYYGDMLVGALECKFVKKKIGSDKGLAESSAKAQGMSAKTRKVFHLTELLACAFPPSMRRVFECSYHELKKDYLLDCQKFRARKDRKWVTFWFCTKVAFAVVGSAWAVCSDSLKRILLRLLPHFFDRFRGN